jgi:hypothetical protein
MSFEQLLSALQGFLGRTVGIGIGAARSAGPGLVGTIAGTLAGGLEVREGPVGLDASVLLPPVPSGTLYFHVREDEHNGFFLHREHFEDAWWEPGGSGHLVIVTGGMRIVVSDTGPDQQ